MSFNEKEFDEVWKEFIRHYGNQVPDCMRPVTRQAMRVAYRKGYGKGYGVAAWRLSTCPDTDC